MRDCGSTLVEISEIRTSPLATAISKVKAVAMGQPLRLRMAGEDSSRALRNIIPSVHKQTPGGKDKVPAWAKIKMAATSGGHLRFWNLTVSLVSLRCLPAH